MRIVLASESPFRKRAMDLIGLPYETRPSRIDEKAIRDDDPAQLTRKLAEAKAHKVAGECPNAVIVSGDAVAAKGRKIFEKPRTKEEAASFLREFSGSEFQFVTSIAVLNAQTRRMLSAVETLDISFRPLLARETVEIGVIPKPRVFTSGARDLAGAPFLARRLREKACPERVEGWGFFDRSQLPQ